MKNYQWLAEVRVKVGDKKYSLSTGVPLSRRYVLTTGHGVPKPGDKKRQAEVRFVADFHHEHSWRLAKTVWHGGDVLDAALLEIAEVTNLYPCFYTSVLPDTTTAWEGAGFPAASKITEGELAGEREPKGLCGKYLPGGNLKSRELDLTVESPPKIPGKWAGISGTPVFCESKLIGILKSYPEAFEGHRLSALPMRRLLENDDFRKLLGYDEREKERVRKQAQIELLLTNSKNVLAALCAQPALQNQLPQPHAVAAALMVMEFEEFIHTVFKASLAESVRDGKARQTIEEILGELLPWLFDKDMIASMQSNLSTGMLVNLPVATETIAEIIMAGYERRPALYHKPVTSDQYPLGAPLIEVPPECGFTPQKHDEATAFDLHLFKKFASADFQGKRTLDVKTLRVLVNGELRHIAKFGKLIHPRDYPVPFRCYFICMPKNEQDLATFLSLQSEYPELIFIILNDEPQVLVKEREQSKLLRDFFAPKPGEDAA